MLRKRSAQRCWSLPAHGILTITHGAQQLFLLDVYSTIIKAVIDGRCADTNASVYMRHLQNACMMYKAILTSINGHACASLTPIVDMRKHDGPTLLLHLLQSTHTTTFMHLQTAHKLLAKISAKSNSTTLPRYILLFVN